MNRREDSVAARYQDLGYTIIRGGAPDFMAIKVEDCKIIEVEAVEVKTSNYDGQYVLTPQQAIWTKICERALIPHHVELIWAAENPDELPTSNADHINLTELAVALGTSPAHLLNARLIPRVLKAREDYGTQSFHKRKMERF